MVMSGYTKAEFLEFVLSVDMQPMQEFKAPVKLLQIEPGQTKTLDLQKQTMRQLCSNTLDICTPLYLLCSLPLPLYGMFVLGWKVAVNLVSFHQKLQLRTRAF